MVVDPANEAELRAAVKSALENGQGVMSVVWPVNKLHEMCIRDRNTCGWASRCRRCRAARRSA